MWQTRNNELYRAFTFKDFKEAFSFMQSVASVSEKLQHHPRWENMYNTVQICLTTHDQKNTITEKDKTLARAIDQIYQKHQLDEHVVNVTTEITEVKLFADGGSRGNPGPSSSGYVILNMQDKVLVEHGIYLGITTNNQAEYKALKLGLEEAQKMQVAIVHVYMDSLLVVNQMLGVYKIKNQELLPIHIAIKELAKTFKQVTYNHVPRELNKLADGMVNKALDEELEG